MALDWDPVSGRVGLDWPVTRQGGVRLDHAQRALGVFLPSTATETVVTVQQYFKDAVGSPTVIAEVYDAGSVSFGAPTTTTFRPNEDVSAPSMSGGSATGVPTNTVGNRYTNYDEAALDSTDYLRFAAVPSGTGTVEFRVASAGGLGAGTQLVSTVRLMMHIRSASFLAGWSFAVYITSGGTDYGAGSFIIPANSALVGSVFAVEMSVNPTTGRPWTEAEVVLLDSTYSIKVVAEVASPGGEVYINQAYVEVDHIDDNRLAYGSAVVSSEGYVGFPLNTNWAKASGTDYLVTFRRTSDTGTCVIPTLDSGAEAPFGHGTYQPTLDSAGHITDLGDLQTPVAVIGMILSAGTPADYQPYHSLTLYDVDAANTVKQEITATGTTTIGWLSAVVASQRSAVPSADLLVKVKKRSDNSQIGGDATFGPHVVEDAPLAPIAVDTTMATTGSRTATQWYNEFTSTAPEGEGWRIAVLDSGGGTLGFGGTTDRAEIGGVEFNGLDVVTTQGTVPTAPANFAAADNTTGEGSIDLTWTATSLAADFDRYELERLHGSTWRTIAHISTEATASYVDESARRGVQESYRLRVRQANGTVSLPTATASDTLTYAQAVLVCPENTSLSRPIYLNPKQTFARKRDRSEQDRLGRDYPTYSVGPSKGKSFDGVMETDGTAGWTAASDWTEAVEDADVEQFVLLNGAGERRYVAVAFPTGVVEWSTNEAGDWQTVAFHAVEIDDVPVIVEVP